MTERMYVTTGRCTVLLSCSDFFWGVAQSESSILRGTVSFTYNINKMGLVSDISYEYKDHTRTSTPDEDLRGAFENTVIRAVK